MRKILTILCLFVCIYANSATYYFRNTGNANWGTATNWSLSDGGGSGGAVPTASDNAYITVNSYNCTLNVAGVCKTLNINGFTGTLTMTNGITISGNTVINSPSMTFSGTGTLTTNAAGLFKTNGKTITPPIAFTGAIIDSLDCSGGIITNITFNTAGATLILKSAVVIQGKATSTASTAASPVTIKSSVGGTKISVIFYNDASMDLDFVNFTDVDASNGLTIYTYLGVLSNTINIDNTMNNTIKHSTATPISGN
jgi:hypothetical protein